MTTGDGGPRRATPADPSGAGDPAALARALTELRTGAGLTIREVGRRTGIPSATLGGWFSGRHLPPASQKQQLAAVLDVLGAGDAVEEWWTAVNRVRRVGSGTAGGVPPYRGLESYGVDDATWFVGREELTDELVGRVTALLDRTGGPGLVCLVGASGSGKSSLLRAGLVARLAAADVATVLLEPGPQARAELAGALDVVDGAAARVLVVDQLEELFAAGEPERRAFLEQLVALAEEPGTVVVAGLRADFYGAALAEPLLLPLLGDHQVPVGPLSEEALRRVVEEPAARAGRPPEPELVALLLRDVVPAGRLPDPSALPLLSHALLATWERARGARLTVADYLEVGGVAGAVQRTAEELYAALSPEGQRRARRLFAQLVNVDEEGAATRRRAGFDDLDDDPGTREVAETFVDGRILTVTETTVEVSHEVLLTAWPRLRAWLAEDREALLLRRRLGRAAEDWVRSGRDPALLAVGPQVERVRAAAEAAPGGGLTPLERSYVEATTALHERQQRLEERRARRVRIGVVAVALLALATSVLSAYLLESGRETDRLRAAAETARNEAQSRQAAVQADHLRATEPALAAQIALAAYRLAPTVEARSVLLETTGLAPTTRLTGPEGTVRAVASPDGRLLAVAGSDGRVRLLARDEQGATPQPVGSVEAAGGGPLYAAAFSPDGRLVAVGGGPGAVTVLDVSDPTAATVAWTVRAERDEEHPAVQDLVFSDDGRTLLVATSGSGLQRRRAGDGRLEGPVLDAPPLLAVDAAPDGTVAVGGEDGLVQLWRPGAGGWQPSHDLSLGGAAHDVRSVAFSPDGGLLAAGATDRLVRVWRTDSGRPATEPLGGFTSWVNDLAFDDSGTRLAAAASGGLVQLWRTQRWSLEHRQRGPANYTSVALLDGGAAVLSGALDGTVHLTPLTGPQLPRAGDHVWGLAAPDTGDVLYVGVGSAAPQVLRVDVTDPLSPRLLGTLTWRGPGGDSLDGVVTVTADGRLLVAGTRQGRLVVWRDPATDPERTLVVRPAQELVENLATSADGRHVAATADDGSTTVYAVEGDRLREVLATDLGGAELALGVALSPDGGLVASGGTDRLVRLWATDEPDRAPEVLDGFESSVYGLAFSRDGSLLAGGGADGTVRLWSVTDPEDPEPLATLRGPSDTVFSVAFDPEGSTLAAASQDGRLWLWRLDDGRAELFARLGTLGGAGYQALHHPTAEVVLAGGAEGRVSAWSTDVQAARDRVCATAGSALTQEEWEQYLPGVPYDPPC
ncbi:helix-turn-helix domain-containing protein [Nocardioides caldifontis]|uniref:nSTAND1 domain-containing NTPase n=1 Tax=Nocardioides caldifontis TaxID=2588938 RepID=UPI0011DF077C|nr:helix-turn-helix domain-containing protein [Nocardioides caldifontis]